LSKTIFITGSSSGIGAASVKLFHSRGWNVVATMRSPDKTKQFDDMQNVLVVRLDVTDPASIAAAVAQALERFGVIDVLVNNAGYGMVGAFEASTEMAVERQFATNVFGLMNVTRAVLPTMREHGGGAIINVSSVGGQITFPLYSVYHATKFAVEGFSESLRYELNEFGIKIKLVEPGPIKTDFYDRSQHLTVKPGLDAYDSFIGRTLPTMQLEGQGAPGPELVAKTIFKAATDSSKRLRYSVNAAGILALRKLLPDVVAFAIVKMRLIK
jgi:NAD(P)-dependent dehydrogenase (short-subunit alcohol dehydrogenase family)